MSNNFMTEDFKDELLSKLSSIPMPPVSLSGGEYGIEYQMARQITGISRMIADSKEVTSVPRIPKMVENLVLEFQKKNYDILYIAQNVLNGGDEKKKYIKEFDWISNHFSQFSIAYLTNMYTVAEQRYYIVVLKSDKTRGKTLFISFNINSGHFFTTTEPRNTTAYKSVFEEEEVLVDLGEEYLPLLVKEE